MTPAPVTDAQILLSALITQCARNRFDSRRNTDREAVRHALEGQVELIAHAVMLVYPGTCGKDAISAGDYAAEAVDEVHDRLASDGG